MKKKRIKITGVPKSLNFDLYNMADHLAHGGIVQAFFNGDGTIFIVRKINKEDFYAKM